MVVCGAGFAGLAAARRLAGQPVDVTIVDRNNFHTFQPLLYQVATAGLEPGDVAYPVRAICGRTPNLAFRHGRVATIDIAGRSVVLDDGSALTYDHLVVASGTTAAYVGIPGAAEHALALYTLRDARRVRNRLLLALEAADVRAGEGPHGLTVVVVGGGATGVEMAGAVSELLAVAMARDLVRLAPQLNRVLLVDAADRLLPGFGRRSSEYARRVLTGKGIEVRLGTAVAEVVPGAVVLRGGERVPADAVIWAAGVTAAGTVASDLPGPRERGGRVVVEPDLSLPGHPEVHVVGDAAAVPVGPGHKGICPQLAQVAIQSGEHAAEQILRTTKGSASEPFRYRDKGIMATIGRRAAVAEVSGALLRRRLLLRGTLGWLAWLGLHLVYLIGFRNLITVLVNWCWRHLNWPSGPRLIVTDNEEGA